jgi:hypothetical protein
VTQPQSPNGDAKAIELTEDLALIERALHAGTTGRVHGEQEAECFDAVVALGSIRTELEEVRLELDRERQEHERVESVARFEVEGLEQQLATERARAEEAERHLAESDRTREEAIDLLAAANARADEAARRLAVAVEDCAFAVAGREAANARAEAIAEDRRIQRIRAADAEIAATEANARAGRLEEALRGVVPYLRLQARDVSTVADNLERILSAAPQVSTEQVKRFKRGDRVFYQHRIGTVENVWSFDGYGVRFDSDGVLSGSFTDAELSPAEPVATSLIPQVAQASAKAWLIGALRTAERSLTPEQRARVEAHPSGFLEEDQPRTTSAELAGGDPFAKAEPGLTAEQLKAQLVAALRALQFEDPVYLARCLAVRLEGGK